jgi:hypothetical protein
MTIERATNKMTEMKSSLRTVDCWQDFIYSSGPRSGRLAKWEILQRWTGWSLHQKDPSSPIFFDLARKV